ncbi:MAG: hypothetical protein A2Z03_08495 [Chloroflexi bacterium RBG_16_56_8]|nr:MAG: hypothetical protein A2Z03_08495 [Chloroflexi bacterium RBG_16_56_8]
MSRIKVSKRSPANQGARRKEWPAVVYFWIIGLTLVSYVVTRIVLDGYPHPYHWLSGLVGGLAGIPIGWLWYRWRGDVF